MHLIVLLQSINFNSSLSDVFSALEIAQSVSNIRRFNYIAKVRREKNRFARRRFRSSFKVVQILFKEKLGELSGNAQRSLFHVIGRMIDLGSERSPVPHPRSTCLL